MDEQRGIYPESRRIARNTVLLYGRMFLLLLIGLFTSRVVLRELGVEDYGVYNAVGGLVTLFTLVSASVTQAIVRYISYSLGQGDAEKLRRVFSTSIIIQCIFATGKSGLKGVSVMFIRRKRTFASLTFAH